MLCMSIYMFIIDIPIPIYGDVSTSSHWGLLINSLYMILRYANNTGLPDCHIALPCFAQVLFLQNIEETHVNIGIDRSFTARRK